MTAPERPDRLGTCCRLAWLGCAIGGVGSVVLVIGTIGTGPLAGLAGPNLRIYGIGTALQCAIAAVLALYAYRGSYPAALWLAGLGVISVLAGLYALHAGVPGNPFSLLWIAASSGFVLKGAHEWRAARAAAVG